jgi:hypothetical protein
MAPLARLIYAWWLTVALGAAIILIGSVLSADVIALVPGEAVDWLLRTPVVLGIYIIAWLVSPWVSQRLPATRGWRSGPDA